MATVVVKGLHEQTNHASAVAVNFGVKLL